MEFAKAQEVSGSTMQPRTVVKGWQYRYGSEDLTQNWKQLTAPDQWTNLDYPLFPPARGDKKDLWLRVPTPEISSQNASLFLLAAEETLRVYQNQQKIYSFGKRGESSGNYFQGWPWHIIPYQHQTSDGYLYFHIQSELASLGVLGTVYAGSQSSHIRFIVEEDWFQLCLSLLYLFLVPVALFIYLKRPDHKIYLGFAITTLGTGGYSLSRSLIKQLIYDNSVFWGHLDLTMVQISLLGSSYLVFHVVGGGYLNFIKRLYQLQTLVLIGTLTTSLSGFINYVSFLPLIQVISGLGMLALISQITHSAFTGNSEAKTLLIGFSIWTVCGIHDILRAMGFLSMPLELTSLGVLSFLVALAYLMGVRFAKVQMKIKEYSIELESKNKALLKLDDLKDNFLANTTHELKTPLNGIIGITESLLDGIAGDQNKETKENLNLVISSATRLASLVGDILDFSKIKNQDLQLSRSEVDLSVIASLVCDTLRPQMAKSAVKLINEVPAHLQLLSADENRLQQILINLIGNAIKFTHQGEIRVRASVESNTFKIEVQDTGIGIDPKFIDSIFESFEQGDGSIERSYGGTGIGLAITKKLVELHGGTISVQSKLKQGSLFTVLLPAKEGAALQTQQQDAQLDFFAVSTPEENTPTGLTEPTSSPGAPLDEEAQKQFLNALHKEGKKSIWVVDDEPLNLKAVGNQLKLHEFEITLLADGPETLKKLEAVKSTGHKPDLILLDIMMPRMNGYEVCKKIRRHYSDDVLPIIFLSAKNQVHDLTAGFEAGGNDYLTKPFSKGELISRLKNHLRVKDLHAKMVEKRVQEVKYANAMEAAKAVQESLLPDAIKELQHLQVATWYQAAEETGGDWYSCFHDSIANRYYFFLGDVTGHGVSSALITGVACGAIRSYMHNLSHMDRYDSRFVLTHLSKVLSKVLLETGAKANRSMTMVYVCFDPTEGTAQILNNGHCHPLFTSESGTEKTTSYGHILGIHDSVESNFSEVQFSEGDTLLLYSDGLLENTGPKGERINMRKLISVLNPLEDVEKTKAKLLKKGKSTWKSQPPKDDCSFILIRWNPETTKIEKIA